MYRIVTDELTVLIVIGYNFLHEDICINFEAGAVIHHIRLRHNNRCCTVKGTCRVHQWVKLTIAIAVYVRRSNRWPFLVTYFNQLSEGRNVVATIRAPVNNCPLSHEFDRTVANLNWRAILKGSAQVTERTVKEVVIVIAINHWGTCHVCCWITRDGVRSKWLITGDHRCGVWLHDITE